LPWSCHGLALFFASSCHALAGFLPSSCCAMLYTRSGSNYAVAAANNLPIRAPCGAQPCDAEPCDAAWARCTTQSPARHQWQDAPNNNYFELGEATHTPKIQTHTHTHTQTLANTHSHKHTHTHTHTRTRTRTHTHTRARSWH
jgi:hypothetical protein